MQDPILLSDSEPEPDITVLAPRDDFYASGKPGPNDVLLLIEVSDTTLDFDRTEKAQLYAEEGIREYWIVNLTDRCIEIHRDPKADGTWGDVRTAGRSERVGLSQIAGVVVAVADVIG